MKDRPRNLGDFWRENALIFLQKTPFPSSVLLRKERIPLFNRKLLKISSFEWEKMNDDLPEKYDYRNFKICQILSFG